MFRIFKKYLHIGGNMKINRIISLLLLLSFFSISNLFAFEHSLNSRDYFKSKLYHNNTKHLILFTVLKEFNGNVIPIAKKTIPLVINNVYYVYFDTNNIYYQINNMFVQDRQQKQADLVIRVLPNSTLKVLVPSLGRVFKTSVNKNSTFPVPNLMAQDGAKGFYNIQYIKSF